MKQFHCGDVVPGCQAMFRAASEQELFSQITVHAREVHGLKEIPAALVTQVRGFIQEVTAGV